MRATGALAALLVTAGAPAGAEAPVPAVRYEVAAGPGAAELRVEATLAAGASDDLTLDRAALAFVADVMVDDGGGWRPVPARGRFWRAGGCQARGCRLRYRFRLGDAARALDDVDEAALRAGVMLAPTTTWLLRPFAVPAGARFRLGVTLPPGWAFVSGLPRAGDGPDATYEGLLSADPLAPYAAFGALERKRIDVAGGVLDVALARDVAAGPVLAWLGDAAAAIVAFYGRWPVPRLQIIVLPASAGMQGKELGGGGASILLAPGDDPAHGREDWVATHEMVHVATPDLSRSQLWMTEGLATYVEPIARTRAGQLDAAVVWSDMLRGMPRGLVNERDRGMDGTRDWGRLYWGGALFWLLADVEIRAASSNAQSLETALRAVIAAGGDTRVSWPVERFLDAGDRALARPVLRPLYEKMGRRAMPVDLPALWRRLGVAAREGGGVTFDDHAPLARVRAGITMRAGDRGLAPAPSRSETSR
ncbi:MAG TPA: hypothetical protein VMU50_00545 [Polyangia bacterium]|nr:hypothetical protein [Polyangia bacterium]